MSRPPAAGRAVPLVELVETTLAERPNRWSSLSRPPLVERSTSLVEPVETTAGRALHVAGRAPHPAGRADPLVELV
ncbi:hypothetical protein A5777_14270 [Gordonia sp. 852002-10350_SCH5691597]|nr:hypothetical protein A5777_14270 [Gordonia sp. 852002-10350_SCH5691597]